MGLFFHNKVSSANKKAKNQCRLYTNGLPGRDWNIPLFTFRNDGSDDELIHEIEDDLIAFFKHVEKTNELDPEFWLFAYSGGSAPMGDEGHAERNLFVKKMEESGSWIFGVTCSFIGCLAQTSLRMFLSVIQELSGSSHDSNEVTSIASRMRRNNMRKAENKREDEFLALLMRCARQREMSVEGLTDFRLKS